MSGVDTGGGKVMWISRFIRKDGIEWEMRFGGEKRMAIALLHNQNSIERSTYRTVKFESRRKWTSRPVRCQNVEQAFRISSKQRAGRHMKIYGELLSSLRRIPGRETNDTKNM